MIVVAVPSWQNAAVASSTFPQTCRCGHDIKHPLVHPEPKYTTGGWLMLLLGATPNPTHAQYVCSRCSMILGVTKDPKILREFS